jgi:hypothetical protein
MQCLYEHVHLFAFIGPSFVTACCGFAWSVYVMACSGFNKSVHHQKAERCRQNPFVGTSISCLAMQLHMSRWRLRMSRWRLQVCL